MLAVFIVTCAPGLAVVLDRFQLHMHTVIPCLCSLPTEPSPKGRQLGDYVCAVGTDILKFDKKSTDLQCFIFQFWGTYSFFGGAKPTKTPVATGLVTNRCLIQNCITKPYQLAHRPFRCSAVMTTTYVRRLLR